MTECDPAMMSSTSKETSLLGHMSHMSNEINISTLLQSQYSKCKTRFEI